MSVVVESVTTEATIDETTVSVSVQQVANDVAISLTGLQGAQGVQGVQGPSGVVSVSAPLTNAGSASAAQLGLDQSALTIAESQVTNLVADLLAKANLVGGNTFTGTQTIVPSAVGNKGLIVNGLSGQTANLQDWQLNGSVLASINSNGVYQWGTSGSLLSPTGSGLFIVNAATVVPMTLKGAASQSANLLEIQDSAATILARVSSGGTFINTGGISTSNSTNTGANALFVNSSVAGNVVAVIRGAASQTADLQQWQTSTGSTVASVNSGGGVRGLNIFTNTAYAGISEENSGGFIRLTKVTSGTNPAAGQGKLYFRDGTNAGTLKLVVRAGAAGAETTILDNIPQ